MYRIYFEIQTVATPVCYLKTSCDTAATKTWSHVSAYGSTLSFENETELKQKPTHILFLAWAIHTRSKVQWGPPEHGLGNKTNTNYVSFHVASHRTCTLEVQNSCMISSSRYNCLHPTFSIWNMREKQWIPCRNNGTLSYGIACIHTDIC